MTTDQLRAWVVATRELEMEQGCKHCAAHTTLVLKGTPTLSQMYRQPGMTQETLKQAMEERGWFCRGCASGRGNVAAVAATRRDIYHGLGPAPREASEAVRDKWRNEWDAAEAAYKAKNNLV